MEIDSGKLENALSGKESKKKSEEKKTSEMSKEMEIGFHQGALNTLVNERNELFKMIQNVEAVMQAHIKRLEELGIKIQKNK